MAVINRVVMHRKGTIEERRAKACPYSDGVLHLPLPPRHRYSPSGGHITPPRNGNGNGGGCSLPRQQGDTSHVELSSIPPPHEERPPAPPGSGAVGGGVESCERRPGGVVSPSACQVGHLHVHVFDLMYELRDGGAFIYIGQGQEVQTKLRRRDPREETHTVISTNKLAFLGIERETKGGGVRVLRVE